MFIFFFYYCKCLLYTFMRPLFSFFDKFVHCKKKKKMAKVQSCKDCDDLAELKGNPYVH